MSQPLFVQISVSLDGYIEDASGDIEWMTSDLSLDPVATATLESIDGMVFGRKAHALLAQFWPNAAAGDEVTPDLVTQARLMNALPKYVLTHGEETTGWENSHAIRLEDLARLKVEAGRPIALFAGAQAVQQALAAGVVDEIRLIAYPILLGAGTPLFVQGGGRVHLSLLESRGFSSGATLSRYRVQRSG